MLSQTNASTRHADMALRTAAISTTHKKPEKPFPPGNAKIKKTRSSMGLRARPRPQSAARSTRTRDTRTPHGTPQEPRSGHRMGRHIA